MDIGIDAYEAERRLTTWFDRATAVMLIDEADAFTAKRSKDSLKRNTLASGTYLFRHINRRHVPLTINESIPHSPPLSPGIPIGHRNSNNQPQEPLR
jgi:hypothetical protein